ncbi:meiotic recombination protein REC114 [Cololabis saira]|uniref:meiotic recombination protein REC114 n=1 Tax=Cololabis saira TaxID=129043 RepID=UPI002AD488B2|nr:meiotic recombination protein REC114 [Cololabis saira]
MAASHTWKLKHYGRLVLYSGQKAPNTWKIFKAEGDKPEVALTILESGYLLVFQGQDCLDSIPLLSMSDSLKVQHKCDNLIFRFTVQGKSRMIRMQFDGSNRAEAINACSCAAENLKTYVPVTTLDDQPPTDVPAPETQKYPEATVDNEPEVGQGYLSVKHLIKDFLGETAVSLPQIYHHSPLAGGDLEGILRVCLLDPHFHVFVERVEGELKKLLQE